MLRYTKTRQAFTLVEILVVVIILAALALIALPSLLGQRDKAKDSQTRANVTNTYKALKAEYSTGELYSTAVVTSAITNEPGINAIMVTGGSAFAYPSGKIEVSLLNSQTVLVAGKAASGKTFLLAAKEQNPGGGVTRVAETNKFLTLSPVTNLVINPSFETGAANTTTGNCSTTMAVSTFWDYAGSQSLHCVGTVTNNDRSVYTSWVPASAGTSYTGSARLNVIQKMGDGAGVILQFSNDCATPTTTPAGPRNTGTGQMLVQVTATAPVGTTCARLRILDSVTTATATWDVYIDAVSLTASSQAFDYFDGDSPGGAWAGTPHASSSTGYAGTSW